MLKKVTILLVLLLSLCACRPSSAVDSSANKFSILSINQTPTLALLGFSNDDYPISVTSNSYDIETAFDNEDSDIIIAPINIGVSKCLNSDNYKLLAILVHSRYYICSYDEGFYKGDVGVYGKGLVIEGVLNSLSEDLSTYNFVYYDDLNALHSAFESGEIGGVILTEIDYNNYDDYKQQDIYKIEEINNIYQSKYSFADFPTYGLFVSNDVLNNYQNDLSVFTRTMRNSISQYKNDKTTFNKVLTSANLEKLGLDNGDLISQSYNYCGLDFVYAVDDFDCLSTLLSLFDIELSEKILVQ